MRALSLSHRFCVFCALLAGTATSASPQVTGNATQSEQIETGIITGSVYDSQSGNVVRGASVAVTQTKQTVTTDMDGKYALKLPPGKYKLNVSAEGYFDQPVEEADVTARRTNYIDLVLVPKTVLSEKVVVTADTVQTATVKSTLLERQASDTIVDNVSAEDIRKNPDGDAAAVMERVTGVSVVQDKFVYVRGLGERYSSTMVNGSAIPSTEPEKKVVALDLFPSNLINKISAVKSYTPDQPGDFSGALVKVDTVEFPPEFMMKYSVGVGFNSNTTGKPSLTYRGTHLDWTSFGYGGRAIPADFPDERITTQNPITGSGYTPEELQHYGRELPDKWEAKDGKAAPDFAQSLSMGGTYKNLGGVFAFTYGRKFHRYLESVNSYVPLNGQLRPWNTFTNDRNTETVKMGMVGNLSYKLTNNNKLLFRNFWTQDSGDETRFLYGYSNGNTADERDTRLRYCQERIFTTQLAGEHYLKRIWGSLLEWRMSYSHAFRGEPDLAETIYRSEKNKNDYSFSPEGQSGFRQFSDQNDRIYEPGLDWTFYLIRDSFNASFKVGGLYQNRTRDFSSRRFVFQIQDRSIDLKQPAELLFSSENIAPDRIELREITRFTDTYDAEQDIRAGYAFADFIFAQKWRFLGGVRLESSRLAVSTFDPYAPALTPIVTRLDNTDPLPAFGVVYLIKPTMNLRAGYSRTLNRPEFRELAPFQFTDISGRSTILGNPNLKQAKINNYDIRWEWFRGGTDLFAASVFDKQFLRPIERVLFYAADVLTSFANIGSARGRGFELEMKKNLGFLPGTLQNLNFYANYSQIRSNVVIGDIPGLVLTSKERPLQGQADYIVNGVLEYANPRWMTELRLLYNLVGKRITDVGATGLPDVYEQPNHFLDLSYSQRFRGFERMQFRFVVQNILNRPITQLQGDQVYYQYSYGRTFGIGLSFDIY